MASWADDSEANEDVGWSTVTSGKERRKEKPVLFGKGITSYQTFHMKHRCHLVMPFLGQTEEHQFQSVSHFVQAQKVFLFGTTDKFERILASHSEQEMHKISQSLEQFDKDLWRRMEVEVVRHGYLHKFYQNEEFRKELLSTVNRDIILVGVEWWGIGAAISANGRNVLGQILCELRNGQ